MDYIQDYIIWMTHYNDVQALLCRSTTSLLDETNRI